ncbi:MAG: guanylate kinase [Vicinamibacteria bacterium]|nr:guanylate kinase [Vicinamibacteria bacterium]
MNDRGGLVFVVSAPSGAGKSSVLRRVLAELSRLRFSVSHTTRRPRVDEEEGADYSFVSRERFEAMIRDDRFLEWAEVHGQLYGTSREEIARATADEVDLMLDVDVQGAAQVRRRMPSAITVFILPPSRAALDARLRGRGGQDDADIERRLGVAREEIERFREYDYVVVNERIEECVELVKSVIQAARCRTTRMRDAARGVIATF